MISHEQRKDLAYVETEMASLAAKRNFDKTDERRMGVLKSQAASIRAGASLRDIKLEDLGESKDTSFLTSEQRSEHRGWKHVLETGEVMVSDVARLNRRDMVEDTDNIKTRIGTYTGNGFFVPTGFYPQLFTTMKDADALFDEDAVTVIKSATGAPFTIPLMSDVEHIAAVVSESGSQTTVDIASADQAVLGSYSYSTNRWVVSMEAFQDAANGISILDLFKASMASQLARGIGKDMVTGNGTAKPLGLIPSLEAVGAPVITAAGSNANDGDGLSGANSLGSQDFTAALQTIDSAYLSSPKCAFFMSNKTLNYLAGLLNKFGGPLGLVQFDGNGQARIFGINVRICPSMDSIGASNYPVVLGDGSYWATRLSVAADSGIRVYTEAPGLIDNGNVGLRTFVRADGELLYKDSSAPSPFVLIQNHS